MATNRERRPSFFGDWHYAGYDPFQVFEVHHKPCLILNVAVRRGRNITKGWAGDLVDTPDPYVLLKMPTAPSGVKRTKHNNNQINPVWNEGFRFLLTPEKTNKLEVILMDANVVIDETIGSITFNIDMLPMDFPITGTFYFNQSSQVDLEFLLHIDRDPQLRFSLALCDQEKDFRNARRERVFEAMQKQLGDRGPKCSAEAPVVAVMGSGGGFRAMSGLSGACTALVDSGIMDMCTYFAGLSGSAWYISQLYAHESWPEKSPGLLQKELRRNVTSSWVKNLFSASSMYRYISNIIKKQCEGLPVSFTDFFGYLVGETLLPKRMDAKLSDQRAKLEEGAIPMPIYSCLHVKKHVSAMIFHEWVEFTPYEIGMPKYGVFMPSELFGSKFFHGQLVKRHSEQPLHYLQGIWGSAFTILMSRLFSDHDEMDPTEMMRLENREVMEESLLDGIPDQDSESSDTSDSEDEESDDDDDDNDNKRPRKSNKKESQRSSFWSSMLETVCNSAGWFTSREGRAAMIHSFLRGLSFDNVYPYSPFSVTSRDDDFGDIFELYPTDIKKLYMVDGGLAINSPYPTLLRPQRAVDVILSFDFSARPSDDSPPFKELKIAERGARINHVSFPPINEEVFYREPRKECYVFKDPYDPYCPVVIHFVLVNIDFRKFKEPGVERQTTEESVFANFDIFDDPNCPYSTFNFTYTEESFDRLTSLTKFNTLKHVELIKDTIAECIRRKQQFRPRRPIRLRDIKALINVTNSDKKELENYCKNFESFDETDAEDNHCGEE